MRALALVLVTILLAGCGAAAAPNAGRPGAGTASLGELVWHRLEVPEGSFSIEVPREALQRRVRVDAEGHEEFQYAAQIGEQSAIVIVSAPLYVVLARAKEREALDRVGAGFVSKLREQGCEPSAVGTVDHQARPGRAVLGTSCDGLHDGAIAAATFLQAPWLVSVTVVTDGAISPEAAEQLRRRVFDSMQFASEPTWFDALTHVVEVPEVEGLHFSLPGEPARTEDRIEGAHTITYATEPRRGMATVVNVTPSSSVDAAMGCNTLTSGRAFTEPTQRPLTDGAFRGCRAAGRRAADAQLYEIHDVVMVRGTLVDMAWAGPNEPAFIAGGEAQLAAMRASLE